MVSYSGMKLKGEIRESISLDDDDLSDVEDEVFIRDGKNGYKLAEELIVKSPLMPPRKRAAKSEIRTILKRRSNCKLFCKPCCYLYIALSIFIGLITLVVVIVSLFPLPLDKLKQWAWRKSQLEDERLDLLPCNNLRVSDVWSVSFTKVTSESSVRTLDINNDGIEDILFGFGTGKNSNILPPETFCPIFMGVSPPCKGGVIALNGINGDIIWKRWLTGSVFRLQCTVDINGDQIKDCLVVGKDGTLATINSKTGTPIWQLNTDENNIYTASFIADQNNDTIPDILASLSSLDGQDKANGQIVLLSGKNGEKLHQVSTPNGTKTFYMPQLLTNSKGSFVLFGTGTPGSPGNLSVMPLSDLSSGKISDQLITLYEDKFSGLLNPSILVDITGDNVMDIVTSMFTSCLVAINGETFKQIWNISIPGNNSETEITPTPGYFNSDNYTDFMIIYKTANGNNSFTQVFIIDGKTGKLIDNPSNDSIRTQIGGLTLSMEDHGNDMFLFWTKYFGDYSHNGSNLVSHFKLNALSQSHQPPGMTVFRAVDKIQNIASPIKQLRDYFNNTDKGLGKVGQTEKNENYYTDQRPILLSKYGSSNVNARPRNNDIINDRDPFSLGQDYKWSQSTEQNFNDYPVTLEESYPNDESEILNKGIRHSNNRDPRNKDDSKNNKTKSNLTKTKKKNLSDGLKGIYDPRNVHLAKNVLEHDLSHDPNEILKDSFVKTEEKRLRKSRFEQRDVGTHYDKLKEKQEIQQTIQDELKTTTRLYNLWDIESELEMKDRDVSSFRGKRKTEIVSYNQNITSIGAVVKSLNSTNETNSIDIVFITYWEPPAIDQKKQLQQDIDECVTAKLSNSLKGESMNEELKISFKRECTEEQKKLKINYFDKIFQLHFGQITVHRLRIECECTPIKNMDKCAKFLPGIQQNWPSHLGRFGNGVSASHP